jgi:hypothetical protein
MQVSCSTINLATTKRKYKIQANRDRDSAISHTGNIPGSASHQVAGQVLSDAVDPPALALVKLDLQIDRPRLLVPPS